MNRAQLEHIIRASAEISKDDVVVVGSQAILGSFPDPPPSLLVSIEADVFPRSRPELADLIAGSIGEGSIFQETFGYYAHGIGPETITAPDGWQDRLVPLTGANTNHAVGWCLDPLDLALSKLSAGREKDWDFVVDMLTEGLIDPEALRERSQLMDKGLRPTAAVESCIARAQSRSESGDDTTA